MLAHRGVPGPGRPENSVPAVQAAYDAEADGVEVDVRLTADGVLVCCHDPDLRRVAGIPLRIANRPAADLLAAYPHLARLSAVLAASDLGGRRLVVEAKPVADLERARQTAATLQEELRTAPAGLDVWVSSFDPRLLSLIRRATPATALLGEPGAASGPLVRTALTQAHAEVHLHVSTVLRVPDVVATARALGLAVTCWTVNRPVDVRRLDRLGVEAVITDRPRAVRAALHRRRASAA